MFQNIPNKKKFYALILIAFLLSITAYKRSFKTAIETVRFYSESKKSIGNTDNAHNELLYLKNESEMLDAVIGKSIKKPEIVQNEILNFLSNNEFNVTLSNIGNAHISGDDYFTIYSNSVTLKGDFQELLHTVYAFDTDFAQARIATLRFYVKKEVRSSKKELFNDIIFQNYEKNK